MRNITSEPLSLSPSVQDYTNVIIHLSLIQLIPRQQLVCARVPSVLFIFLSRSPSHSYLAFLPILAFNFFVTGSLVDSCLGSFNHPPRTNSSDEINRGVLVRTGWVSKNCVSLLPPRTSFTRSIKAVQIRARQTFDKMISDKLLAKSRRWKCYNYLARSLEYFKNTQNCENSSVGYFWNSFNHSSATTVDHRGMNLSTSDL